MFIRRKEVNNLLLRFLLLVFLMASGVFGAGQADVNAEENEGINGIEITESQNRTDGSTIESINFKKDVKIRDALRFLAAKYHKNIIPSAKVDGNITVTSLYDVTFEEAMNAILGYGFKSEQEGSFIRVYTAEEYEKMKSAKSRMIHRVFKLYYVSAAEAMKLIAPILSTAGVVQSTTAADVGVPTGDSISAASGSGGDTVAMNDTIIIYDYPENIAKVESLIASMDIRPRQVLIEATIMSVTLTEGMQLGIDWQTLSGKISALPSTRGVSDYFSSSGSDVQVGTDPLDGGLTVGFAHDNIAGFIRAAEAITDVTILANPKILAVNKQLGQVYIGKKIGYVSQTTVTETGTTQTVAFLDTGTKLSIRPFIGDDGYIRMDIHPKDSSGTIDTVGEGTVALPTETAAELVTNIIVKDGETIVIGGLFRDTMTNKKSQIPILGDIPLLGVLFGGRADESKREEVMVLLTPHIINEPSEVEGYARAEDVSRKRAGLKGELHSLSRAKLADERYAKAAKYYLEGDKEFALREVNSALAIRPAYLEALRLKERIIAETQPGGTEGLKRKVIEAVESGDVDKWLRR